MPLPPMEKLITFKTKNYFEGVVYVLGWAFGLIGVMLLLTNWLLSTIFGFLAFLIITAHYKVTINLNTREIDDFLFIMGMRAQKERFKYETLDYIYISQSRYTQQMNYKSISATVAGELFNAYLKSDAANIFLGESKDLTKLKDRIRPLAEQLNLEIKNPQ